MRLAPILIRATHDAAGSGYLVGSGGVTAHGCGEGSSAVCPARCEVLIITVGRASRAAGRATANAAVSFCRKQVTASSSAQHHGLSSGHNADLTPSGALSGANKQWPRRSQGAPFSRLARHPRVFFSAGHMARPPDQRHLPRGPQSCLPLSRQAGGDWTCRLCDQPPCTCGSPIPSHGPMRNLHAGDSCEGGRPRRDARGTPAAGPTDSALGVTKRSAISFSASFGELQLRAALSLCVASADALSPRAPTTLRSLVAKPCGGIIVPGGY